MAPGRIGFVQFRDDRTKRQRHGDVKSCHHKGLGQREEACVTVAGGIFVQEAMRQELVLCLTGTFEGLVGLKER